MALTPDEALKHNFKEKMERLSKMRKAQETTQSQPPSPEDERFEEAVSKEQDDVKK